MALGAHGARRHSLVAQQLSAAIKGGVLTFDEASVIPAKLAALPIIRFGAKWDPCFSIIPFKTQLQEMSEFNEYLENSGPAINARVEHEIRILQAANNAVHTIPEERAQHIFQDKHGRIEDTPENRARLLDVADDPDTTLGPDKHGNTSSARNNPDGSQAWVQTRGKKLSMGVFIRFHRLIIRKQVFLLNRLLHRELTMENLTKLQAYKMMYVYLENLCRRPAPMTSVVFLVDCHYLKMELPPTPQHGTTGKRR